MIVFKKIAHLLGRLRRKVTDSLCIYVIKTRLFLGANESLGPMWSFRGPGAQFRSDVVQCTPMR